LQFCSGVFLLPHSAHYTLCTQPHTGASVTRECRLMHAHEAYRLFIVIVAFQTMTTLIAATAYIL